METAEPWLAAYGTLPHTISSEHETALGMAQSMLRARGDAPAAWYFDHPISGAQLEHDGEAFACALSALGVEAGDRVALYLQNVPQMLVGLHAAWLLRAIAVPVNPMLRERELAKLLNDSGATVLVALEELFDTVARHVLASTDVAATVTTSPLDYLGDDVPVALAGITRPAIPGAHDLRSLIDAHAGERPPEIAPAPDDIALLVYTSGTTGPSKGAMVLHRNMVHSSEVFRQWARLDGDDVNLVLAPVFHITGLVAGLGASWAAGMPMVLAYRFDAATTLALCARRRPTFTVAAITAYGALMEHPDFGRTDLSCLRAAYSGGASVPAAVAARWEQASRVAIHNAYGLTETTSATHLTPLGRRAPVDAESGTLAVGLPVSDTSVRVVDEAGRALAPREIGEFATAGPQVVPGYWRQPDETRLAFPDGRLRTGDVGFMDEEGWFYLVDRRKDMIVAAGYKVWPREVEDVLYEHPAVREAAVVGAPDSYRGETVVAFVSLRPGTVAAPEELIAFCRTRMAAYKYPRRVDVLAELPKTAAGKILRRTLRGTAGA